MTKIASAINWTNFDLPVFPNKFLFLAEKVFLKLFQSDGDAIAQLSMFLDVRNGIYSSPCRIPWSGGGGGGDGDSGARLTHILNTLEARDFPTRDWYITYALFAFFPSLTSNFPNMRAKTAPSYPAEKIVRWLFEGNLLYQIWNLHYNIIAFFYYVKFNLAS